MRREHSESVGYSGVDNKLTVIACCFPSIRHEKSVIKKMISCANTEQRIGNSERFAYMGEILDFFDLECFYLEGIGK